jgi:hypothetical protein
MAVFWSVFRPEPGAAALCNMAFVTTVAADSR